MSEWHDWGMSHRHERRKAEARIKGPHAAPRTRCRERKEKRKNVRAVRHLPPPDSRRRRKSRKRSQRNAAFLGAPNTLTEGRRPPRMAHAAPFLSSAVLFNPPRCRTPVADTGEGRETRAKQGGCEEWMEKA
ncbi:hypothetical protein HPB48_025584 [Haemaphysalis longicornis]|uniref:Uncharacterized protein n=1 Tax=Haemaphysalis longicornis TaxID=44386 RepID=A0A9J6H7X4_HAELO|nr:hypothetical protein HPB48_025584 [Haemaphysalis longicornis]